MGEFVWEIDEFFGVSEGLIAGIELSSDASPFEKLGWIGEEVSDDSRCGHLNLVKNPIRLGRRREYGMTDAYAKNAAVSAIDAD